MNHGLEEFAGSAERALNDLVERIRLQMPSITAHVVRFPNHRVFVVSISALFRRPEDEDDFLSVETTVSDTGTGLEIGACVYDEERKKDLAELTAIHLRRADPQLTDQLHSSAQVIEQFIKGQFETVLAALDH